MSRTWKDQPIRRQVMNPRIHRLKSVLHMHRLFGTDRVEKLPVYEEDGSPTVTDGHQLQVTLVTGQYADYCTEYMDVDKMPENVFAPCTTWFNRHRQGGSEWADAAEKEWRRSDRQRARIVLQRLARENASDVNDDAVPLDNHRHEASWWL